MLPIRISLLVLSLLGGGLGLAYAQQSGKTNGKSEKTEKAEDIKSDAGPKSDTLKSTDLMTKAPPAKLSQEKIPVGAKVYIAPLNGYESFLVAAFISKGTPVTVVNSREKADYEITGVAETVQAGWAKMLWLGSQQSNEQASIVLTNLRSGEVVWGYNVNKVNSYRGKQSSSEACAKHLKARIEGK